MNLLNNGHGLRAWREAHGVTLEDLAGLTGYSVAMLSRVERGQRKLGALARIRLARVLGVKVGQLFPIEPKDSPTSEAGAPAAL